VLGPPQRSFPSSQRSQPVTNPATGTPPVSLYKPTSSSGYRQGSSRDGGGSRGPRSRQGMGPGGSSHPRERERERDRDREVLGPASTGNHHQQTGRDSKAHVTYPAGYGGRGRHGQGPPGLTTRSRNETGETSGTEDNGHDPLGEDKAGKAAPRPPGFGPKTSKDTSGPPESDYVASLFGGTEDVLWDRAKQVTSESERWQQASEQKAGLPKISREEPATLTATAPATSARKTKTLPKGMGRSRAMGSWFSVSQGAASIS
jgi:hypothetical protein